MGWQQEVQGAREEACTRGGAEGPLGALQGGGVPSAGSEDPGIWRLPSGGYES